MKKNIVIGLVPACIVLCLIMLPGVAWASSGPAQTETLQVGPYVVNVNLAQYPPQTDQSDAVTVVPQNSSVHLSGRILMQPGLGTDAVELRSSLSPVGSSSTLAGSIRMPVRGAWNIVVLLNGPQGQGQATFPIVVAAPGAMPIWLGWVIGLTPLLGVAWLVWHQLRYRRKLMVKTQQG